MRLHELYQEEPGGYFTHDGVNYDLNALLRRAENLPVQEFRVSDLDWVLSQDADPERVAHADLGVPILVAKWRDKLVVLDGYHRLTRAKREGRERIPGKFVPSEWLLSTRIISEAALTELSRPRTRDRAEWILINAGYKHLGRGGQGAAFQKPGAPYVVKLFDARDKAYLTFIRVAMANTDNPHFPKFFGKPIKITDDYWAMRIEPLRRSFGYFYEIGLIDRYITNEDDRAEDSDAFEYVSQQPELQAACDIIVMLIRHSQHDFICDVHQSNVMLRGSTLVLSDPVAMNV